MGVVKRRKPSTQRREVLVPVRVTEAEKHLLITGAMRDGLGVSSWLRRLGLRAAQRGEDK